MTNQEKNTIIELLNKLLTINSENRSVKKAIIDEISKLCTELVNKAYNNKPGDIVEVTSQELNDFVKAGFNKQYHDINSNTGIKYDGDKPRFDLIPVLPLTELAKIYAVGAKKYSDRNWEKGLNYNRLYRAAIGHLVEFWNGNDTNIEYNTEVIHLAQAAFNVFALLEFYLRGRTELDNRPHKKEVK